MDKILTNNKINQFKNDSSYKEDDSLGEKMFPTPYYNV